MKLEKVIIAEYLFVIPNNWEPILTGIYMFKTGNRKASHWYHHNNQKIDYVYSRMIHNITKSFYI
jgi:hypothetical protein